MKKILEGCQLTKKFGELFAVEDLNFFLGEEEMVAILGPSGCGKSTLLRMIAGFEEPDGGKIIFGGKTVPPLHSRFPTANSTASLLGRLAA